MNIHARIQKWGNGLALRIGGLLREIPQFKEGSEVDIEITEDGFLVKKSKKKPRLPFTEAELLKGLSPQKAHHDLLALPSLNEFESP